jgi:hypothetical protein
MTVVILFLFLHVYQPASQWWGELVAQVEAWLGGMGIASPPGIPVAINLFLLAGYGSIKAIVNLPLRMRGTWQSRFGLGLAYRDDDEQGVVLDSEWVYPGVLLRYAGWIVGGGLLVLSLVHAAIWTLPIAMPMLPVLPLLLLLETGWYLGGNPRDELPDEFSGTDARSSRHGDYRPLWEEYLTIWPDQWLTASEGVQPREAAETASSLYRRPEAGEGAQLDVTHVWHALIAAGHPLSDLHFQILDRLWKGDDVLIGDRTYQSVSPVLFAALRQALVQGHSILVLLSSQQQHDAAACGAVEAWIREGLAGEKTGSAWRIARFEDFYRAGSLPDLMIASPEQLLASNALQESWFSKIRTMLVLDGDRTIFQAPMHTDALVRSLRRTRPDLQQVILSSDRRSLESAIRDNLAAQVHEYRTPRSTPRSSYAICWRMESDTPFQHRVVIGPADRDLGVEPILALPAWRDGIQPILLLNQEELPWAEHLEELDNHLDRLRDPVPASRVRGSAREVLEVPPMPQMLTHRDRAFALAHDQKNNLPETLRTWLPLGAESSFVHVVSPPYLLRDYLAANVAYFLRAPLLALSPRLIESRFAVLYSCIERMIAAPFTEDELLRELRAVVPHARYGEEALVHLMKDVFGFEALEPNLLSVRTIDHFDTSRGRFEKAVHYQLAPAVRDLNSLHWLRLYRVLDRGERERGLIPLDHLYQTYLPDQVHSFQGKPFRIGRIDHDSGVVWIDHHGASRPTVYRPVRRIELESIRPSSNSAYRKVREEGGWTVDIELCKGSYKVRTEGYYSFDSGIDLSPSGFRFTPLTEERVPVRSYSDAFLLRLVVRPGTGSDLALNHRIADTLGILLHELFPTLFPETHHFLLPSTPGSATRLENDHLRALLPLLTVGDGAEEFPDDAMVLYFFEDSHAPLGLLRSLFDEHVHVFAILEDYLSWILEADEENPLTVDGWRRHMHETDTYLCFGMETPPEALDLASTHAFLRQMGRQRNALRTERRDFYRRIREDRDTAAGRDGRECDFCAGFLPETEFERMEDGRERCTQCKASAVDSVRELKQVFEEARQFFARELRHPLRRGIQVRFASSQEVQEAAGQRFLPSAEFDDRVIGVARRTGTDFEILIEKGHPRHRTLGTIVHELTHIWQFRHLDYQRLKAEHDLLLIEGHAQWAELNCLERKGLAPEYREQEANRGDVYGHGHRMVLEWQSRFSDLGNPFDILLDRYPAPRRR